VAAARHRRTWLLLTFAAGLIVALVLAVSLPARYRSAATILIQQQEMPQDMVRSTVTSYADERVQVISKRVMTTETLLNIIRRYDLYPKERAKATRESLLAMMRGDIGLRMISADVIDPRNGHPTEATIAFEVSYTSVAPDLAAKVANELTTLFLNENLNDRTQLARGATQFLESEGDRLSRQISDLEGQLARFKDKHLHELPDLVQLNMSLLDRTEEEVRSGEARQTALEQQRVFLEAQLALLKPNSVVFSDSGERITSSADRLKMARSQLDAARAVYAPDHPDVIRLQREVEGLQREIGAEGNAQDPAASVELLNDLRRRLEQAQARLTQARERYGPDHPDRQRLEREVEQLKKEVAQAPPPAPPDSQLKPVSADNPAYIEIKSQLASTLNQLKATAAELAKLRAQALGYEHSVNLSPAVEKEYRELVRDYDNARLKYQDLRSKQVEAKTAQDLEADRKGERFELIDPPLPPETPISPNRKMILATGALLSLALAAGLLWLLESLDTSVRGRADLQQLLGVPALALVPRILTDGDRLEGRRRAWIATGTAAASLCVAALLVHLLYRPLDVILFAALHTFGLS
jgi:uncharacterized protein involved in exopolysaccharide biosynthesis